MSKKIDKECIVGSVLDCAIAAATNLDIENDDFDRNMLWQLLECAKKSMDLPGRRRKRYWIQNFRKDRKSRAPNGSLGKELRLHDAFSSNNYLRMSREQFDYLLSLIENDFRKQNTTMREAIPPEDLLSATLRFLATGESYVNCNLETKISGSTLSNAVPKICSILYEKLKTTHMQFPSSSEDWEKIAQEFASKWDFPNCIGALDSTFINFKAPKSTGGFYINYKGSKSIVLLALVDANCRFLFVDAGCNGAASDEEVLAQSSLKTILDNPDEHLPTNQIVGQNRSLPFVFIADEKFSLQKNLIIPFPDYALLPEKRIFNIRLSRTRYVVEHTFHMLTKKFKILDKKISLKADKVTTITLACCVLHNFLMDKNRSVLQQHILKQQVQTASHSSEGKQEIEEETAGDVRNGFLQYFNKEGRID